MATSQLSCCSGCTHKDSQPTGWVKATNKDAEQWLPVIQEQLHVTKSHSDKELIGSILQAPEKSYILHPPCNFDMILPLQIIKCTFETLNYLDV